jgi:hypothetical protein
MEEVATDSRSNQIRDVDHQTKSLSFALLCVDQRLEIRYPDRCTISEGDYCLQRIRVEGPQRFVGDITHASVSWPMQVCTRRLGQVDSGPACV